MAKEGATSVAVSAKDNNSTAVSIFDKFEKDRNALTEFKDPRQFIDNLGDKHGLDIAKKYYDILNVIKSSGEHDQFQPQMLRVCSGKETDSNVLKKVGIGQLYIGKSLEIISKDKLFFPLIMHRENHWYPEDGGLNCYSCDSIWGERFKTNLAGQKIKCGSKNCPNTPDLYQKAEDLCKATTALYLVDSDFSNIYKYAVRYQAHKLGLNDLLQNSKKHGVQFNPIEAKWFSLVAQEVPSKTDNKKKAWYFRANIIDKEVSAGEAEIIGQLKALMLQYQESLKLRRYKKSENAEQEMRDLESQNFDVSETIDEEGHSIVNF